MPSPTRWSNCSPWWTLSCVPDPTPALHLPPLTPSKLVACGRHIKNHQAQAQAQAGPELLSRQEDAFKRTIGTTDARFQTQLDDLETEILIAQDVVRRDLALRQAIRRKQEAAVKEKQREKEKEKEAERARLAAEMSAVKKEKEVAVKKEALPAPPAPMQSETIAPVKTEPVHSSATAREPVSLKGEMDETPALDTAAPAADVTMENADNPNTGQESEFDFDAIFGDGGMDTSGGMGDGTAGTAGPDLNFSLDDQPSLLRGLEDFAKGGTDSTAAQQPPTMAMDLDFNMPDLAASDHPPTTKPEQDSATQQPPADTTASTDDANLDAMVTDDINDLFDLDYENPEATQFDDAFFGFGES